MPTLDTIEGFEHRDTGTTQPLTGQTSAVYIGGTGTWTITAAGRNGYAIQVTETAGVAHNITTPLPISQTRVVSLYFKVPSAPSAQSEIILLRRTSTFSVDAKFEIATSGAIIATSSGTATGPNVADNLWHLLDFYLNQSANPWILQWAVDGVAQTNCSNAQAVQSSQYLLYGTVQTDDTATVYIDDVVASVSGADYPIGTHDVFHLIPDGDSDKTHGGTNIIEDQTGADIDGVAAWSLIEELPVTATEAIRQSAIGSTNYAEITFGDADSTTIWGVQGYSYGLNAAVGSNDMTFRMVDSGGTTLTNVSTGIPFTSQRGGRTMVTAPGGGWTTASLNGVKGRIGFATGVTGGPASIAGVLLQYAAPVEVPLTTRKLQVVTNPRRW